MTGGPHKDPGNAAEKRRTQRIFLKISILVRAQFGNEPPITEDTSTLEVNAHGALISLAMKVRPGQKLILRNWNTSLEQECRVIHMRETLTGKNEVGVAFPFPMPKFWNVQFPP